MAFKHPASISLLLIVMVSCLTAIRVEEELQLEIGDGEGKQIFLVPQTYPVQSPLYFQDSLAYGANPLAMSPPLLSPFNRNQAGVSTWPWAYTSLPLGHPDYAAWRVNDGVDDKDSLKWWKKRFNRQALITIIPSAAECLLADIATNGLGPCKRASDATHGTIEVRFPEEDQAAVIAITSKAPMNTRIRLICTQLNAMAVFTNTGQINAVSDTPRTEIGQMQLVVSSTGQNGILKCSWRSYHFYTAAYP